MKNFRQLSSAVVLTLVLFVSAFAGEMDTPKAIQEPVPVPIATEGQIDMPLQVAGEITTGAPTDSVVEGALSLLQIVLTLV